MLRCAPALRVERWLVRSASAGLVLSFCGALHAQAEAPQQAAAETLFREGRELLKLGKTRAACEKFAASQRIDPAPSTLLNLGLCLVEEGKTASAWSELLAAAALAERVGDGPRLALARDKATELELRLSRIEVVVPYAVSGLQVRLDDRLLTADAFGSARPIDPGMHRLEARAPGKRSWSASVAVANGPVMVRVEIPTLVSETAAPSRSDPGPPVPPPLTDSAPRNQGSARATVGWVAVATGAVGIGVGTFFGVRTLAKQTIVEDKCPQAACSDSAGLAADEAAHEAALLSTIAFATGIPCLGLGAWLLLTGQPASDASKPPRLQLAMSVRSVRARWIF